MQAFIRLRAAVRQAVPQPRPGVANPRDGVADPRQEVAGSRDGVADPRQEVAGSRDCVADPRQDGTPGDGPSLSARTAVVSLRDAAVRIGGRTLWSHVDLDIAPGEFVAVLGPNGVGKSTLVKTILGLVPTAAGSVTVLGRAPGQQAHQVGYLPQRRSFDAGLRIRGVDIVRMGWDGDRWGLPLPGSARAGAARARITRAIDLVGASSYAHRPIGQCSGGEQQRLLIAQALVRHPRLLLLDEPLDSLDLPNQAAVAALIGGICREENVAVVMVAHDANPILTHLDRVVYLAEGGAVAGTPSEVITSETLTRLYRTPIEVLRTSDGRLVVVGQPEPPAVHSDRHDDRHGERHESRHGELRDDRPGSPRDDRLGELRDDRPGGPREDRSGGPHPPVREEAARGDR